MKKLTLDTNVLVRIAVLDDAKQARTAATALREADVLAVPLPVLCELVWVLARGYHKSPSAIAGAMRRLMNSRKVALNRPAVDAGLAVLEAGGDFADGVAAWEGQWLGGSEFVTFDRKAATLLPRHGFPTRLLHSPISGRRRAWFRHTQGPTLNISQAEPGGNSATPGVGRETISLSSARPQMPSTRRQ